MEQDRMSTEEIVALYRPEIEKLLPYISWLQQKEGQRTANIYEGDGIKDTSITFPVYDGTLLNFIKTIEKTKLVNRNYVYTYARKQIHSAKDEKRLIKLATVKDMNILQDILSNYVIKGRTKGSMWSVGVENGVYLDILMKMRELVEFWDKPIV